MNKAQYLDLFIEESQENIEYLVQNLLTLRDNPEDKGLLKDMFRQAHTIKGTAAMMGFDHIAEVASGMESALQELYQGRTEVDSRKVNTLSLDLRELRVLLKDVVKEG